MRRLFIVGLTTAGLWTCDCIQRSMVLGSKTMEAAFTTLRFQAAVASQ
jgi:hypothetical protein